MDFTNYFGFPVVQNLGDVYHWLVYHWWLPEFNTFFWIYETIVFLGTYVLTYTVTRKGSLNMLALCGVFMSSAATITFFVNKYLGNF
jgi:hypothetical protein